MPINGLTKKHLTVYENHSKSLIETLRAIWIFALKWTYNFGAKIQMRHFGWFSNTEFSKVLPPCGGVDGL